MWRGATKPAAIDRARRKVNAEMRSYCRENGFGRVAHTGITYKEVSFFRRWGSPVGMAMYLMELREAVASALGVKAW